MAVGNVSPVGKNAARAIKIAEELTAENSPPATAAAGVPCYPTDQIYSSDTGHCYTSSPARSSTLMVDIDGTSATLTLWGYLAASGKWYPIKELNGGQAITANHVERLSDLGHFDRLYLEAEAVTDATVNAWLVTSRTVSF